VSLYGGSGDFSIDGDGAGAELSPRGLDFEDLEDFDDLDSDDLDSDDFVLDSFDFFNIFFFPFPLPSPVLFCFVPCRELGPDFPARTL
jgi:hypothetical protein